MAKVEIDGKQKCLEILLTTKKTNPLLGLGWMEKLGKTLGRPSTNKLREKRSGYKTAQRKFQKPLLRKSHREGTRNKDTTKRGYKIDTTKRTTNTDPFTAIGWKRY